MKKLLFGFFVGAMLVLCGNSIFAEDKINQEDLAEVMTVSSSFKKTSK